MSTSIAPGRAGQLAPDLPPCEDRWLLTAASVTGRSHEQANLPNQDCVGAATSRDGLVVAAVVSDGAGTAAHSDVGSQTACRLMVPWMLQIGHDLQKAPGMQADMVRDKVIEGIDRVRRELALAGNDLRAYHCTLAACVISEREAYVCVVGDSIALASSFDVPPDGSAAPIDLFPDPGVRLFEPERGEYANETHFITANEWRSHVRVSALPMSRIDALLLMSDGAMDVALTGGKVYRGFLSSLVGSLLATPEPAAREALLAGWLGDRRTYPLTSDDKTLFVAVRSIHRRLAGRAVELADGPAAAVPPLLPSPAPASALTPPALPRPDEPWPTGPGILRSTAFGALVGLCVAAVALLAWTSVQQLRDALMRANDPVQVAARASSRAAAAPAAATALPRPAMARQAPQDDEGTAKPPAPPRGAATHLWASSEEGRAPAAPAAELLLVPNPATELLLHPGKSAQVALRLFGGSGALLKSVTFSPGSRLHVIEGDTPCNLESRLGATPCVVTVQAAAGARPGLHQMTVLYLDLATSRELEVSLPVRLLKAAT